MNAPLPSSGRSVVAALVFVFCLLVPARAAHVAELAPKWLSAAEAHALGLPISNEDAGDLFKLWNECQPIAFSVHLQGKNEASKMGMTKEAIETAVRSRLRGARIFRNNPDLRSQSPKRERNGFLQVQVHLGGTYLRLVVHSVRETDDGLANRSPWMDTYGLEDRGIWRTSRRQLLHRVQHRAGDRRVHRRLLTRQRIRVRSMIERRPPVLFNQFADLAERAGDGRRTCRRSRRPW